MVAFTYFISHILERFGIPDAYEEALNFLLRYPYKGSLKSIEQALKHFNVDSSLIWVTPEKFPLLDQLPTPFIVQVKEGDYKFLLVKKIMGSQVYCYSQDQKYEKYDLEHFLSRFTGNVLIPHKPSRKGYFRTPAYHTMRLNRFISVLLGLFLLVFSMFIFYESPLTSLLFLIKIFGLGLSLFLLFSEYFLDNAFFSSTCHMLGSSCANILKKTKKSSFFSFSWAEMGCIYFLAGIVLILLEFRNTRELPPLLAFLNAPALAFVPYSLYFQKIVSKSWCPFCLITLLIFVGEFFILINLGFEKSLPETDLIILFIIAGLISFLFIQRIRMGLENALKIRGLLLSIGAVKYDPKVIDQLKSNPDPVLVPEDIGFKIFGNSNRAKKHICIVLSPFCPPCRIAYSHLDKLLLESREDEIEVRIVLFTDSVDKKETKTYDVCQKMASYFLQVNGDQHKFRKILTHWYVREKSIYKFIDFTNPITNFVFAKADQLLLAQRNWLDSVKILHTPSIIVDGIILPKGYSVEDIEFLL